MSDNDQPELARLTVELLSAYFTNNSVPSSELPGLIEATRTALRGAPAPGEDVIETYVAAVTIEESLASPQHILSMIDGKGYKTLKRHLSNNGLTPEQYKTRYNLPADYPLVAPDYSVLRRNFARKLGLGGRPAEAATPAIAAKPASEAPAKATARKTVAPVAAAAKDSPAIAAAATVPSVAAPAKAAPATGGAKKPRRMARPASPPSTPAKAAAAKPKSVKPKSVGPKSVTSAPKDKPVAPAAKQATPAKKAAPAKAAGKAKPDATKPAKAKPAAKPATSSPAPDA
ncbi:MucR family transcriptional regulator [Novosphingobium clariflavum]|uniref:MucR family transcriptional regulator n=1 Tax=Novosphingobium clariflavum TaxID=2029884 RepID=A0ABV6SC89_9SPHN|nr:MucR family transcriptional regulator [Novosphingobium clariflavum]